MTEQEIRNNIRYNENQIEQFTQEKIKLDADIEELEALKAKYNSLQNKLDNKRSARKSRLNLLVGSGIQNQIVQKFYDGMNDLVDGMEFNKAYSGLTEAVRIINQKIRALDEKIDACQEKIAYHKDRRDYWLTQLWQFQTQEEK